MISEESCDTKDWSNDAENSNPIYRKSLLFYKVAILYEFVQNELYKNVKLLEKSKVKLHP